MAQSTNKGNKSGSKASASKSSSAKRAKSAVSSAPGPGQAKPIRRELAAAVFLFLAVFTVISYFNNEGAFIVFFTDLLLGLVGWGFWACAPAFLLLAYILFFHKGRPVTLRVSCALLLPVLFAAMANLLLCRPEFESFDFRLTLGSLFEQGQNFQSGGVLGGLLHLGLEKLFSVYGASPLLVLSFLLCLITALNISLGSIADKLAGKPKTKYDETMYEKPVKEQPKSEKNKGAKNSTDSIPAITPAAALRTRRGGFDVDVYMGDDGAAVLPGDIEHTAAKDKNKVKPEKHDGEKPRGTKRPKTEAVIPLEDDEEFKEFPLARSEEKPVTMSAGISDPPKPKKAKKEEIAAEAQKVANSISSANDCSDYEIPPTDLLVAGRNIVGDSREEIRVNSERLQAALNNFAVNASVIGATRGPTVTRYDVELGQGVKLARLTNLAGDLALSLGVSSVRIAPIPEMISTVGIEVPNKVVSKVYLRDVLESGRFVSAKSKLSVALGKDISGECVVSNISKLPHLLIAGTTGSGKSVCINSLILSILYKAGPEDVRFIMIDPKMVELGVYNGIPHLYVPVVTEPKKAAGALQWAVVEMLKRYNLFKEMNVAKLEVYNERCAKNNLEKLPQIVIVIDELADLMMVASKDVEESICRIAQMGRAAGIHLIVATQRPSADVITGLIKSNIPSRIAFAVSSAMESRIILDLNGAEKLIGYGDMLYAPLGEGKPKRIQGSFVSDEEREEVINFILAGTGATEQNPEIEEYMNKAAAKKDSNSKEEKESKSADSFDELLPEAVEIVLREKGCSTTKLQRHLKLGYTRAARIVDQMEELGIVSASEGAKPRTVLIDKSGWRSMQLELGLTKDSDMAIAETLSSQADEDDGI